MQVLYVMTSKESVVSFVFVMKRKSLMRVELIVVVVGICSSKDWTLMDYPSGVVVVVSDRVDTLPAFVVSTLIDRREWI
jgi:hypothetical protein